MTTLSEMKGIVQTILKELSEIESCMASYKKFRAPSSDWGDVEFLAYDFLQSIREEIKKINLALGTYTRPDLQHIYANKNFDDYVNGLRATVKEMRKRCAYFKKGEDLPWFYYPADEDDD